MLTLNYLQELVSEYGVQQVEQACEENGNSLQFFEQVNRPEAPFKWNYEGFKSKA